MCFFHCLECGHFCIKYILKKDGNKVVCDYNKKLMSLKLVCCVLKKYYDSVCCYSVDELSLIDNYKSFLTLIKTKNGGLHYIVVVKKDEKYVYYYDPAFVVARRMKVLKFNDRWSHFCCFYN